MDIKKAISSFDEQNSELRIKVLNKSNIESYTIRINAKYGFMLKLLSKAYGFSIKDSQADAISTTLADYVTKLDNKDMIEILKNTLNDEEFIKGDEIKSSINVLKSEGVIEDITLELLLKDFEVKD